MKKKSSKPRIKLTNFNVLGLRHSNVKKKFEGELTYIGTFCIRGEYTPRAFYHNAEPDRSKKHKDYMTLQQGNGTWYVSGIDAKALEEWRYQMGLQCMECKDVIYSVYRHDMRYCKCGQAFVDGGRDYTRSGGPGLSVMIDLIKGEWGLLEPAGEIGGESPT